MFSSTIIQDDTYTYKYSVFDKDWINDSEILMWIAEYFEYESDPYHSPKCSIDIISMTGGMYYFSDLDDAMLFALKFGLPIYGVS